MENLPNLQSIISRPKAKEKTRIEQITLPFLKSIKWENKTLEKDMSAFWVAVYRYNKSHTEAQFLKLMSWIEERELYPRQAIKCLIK